MARDERAFKKKMISDAGIKSHGWRLNTPNNPSQEEDLLGHHDVIDEARPRVDLPKVPSVPAPLTLLLAACPTLFCRWWSVCIITTAIITAIFIIMMIIIGSHNSHAFVWVTLAPCSHTLARHAASKPGACGGRSLVAVQAAVAGGPKRRGQRGNSTGSGADGKRGGTVGAASLRCVFPNRLASHLSPISLPH